MADFAQVHAEGLREFRRDVRRADKEVGRALQREMRVLAQETAAEVVAPRRTGTLAGSYRGSARGTVGIIRTPVFYGRFIEFGFHPRGEETFVEGTNPIGRAVERNEDRIVEGLGDAVERAAVALGWRGGGATP